MVFKITDHLTFAEIKSDQDGASQGDQMRDEIGPKCSPILFFVKNNELILPC
jgi:hypothetical protein